MLELQRCAKGRRVKREALGGPCQFREGPRQGMDYPARLPYNFPSPPLNCFSSSCRSHPSIASTSASTIATKSTTTQRNALSEPNDASRNAFRTYESCDNFYDIIVGRVRHLLQTLNTFRTGRAITKQSFTVYLEPTRRDSGCVITPKVATRFLERAEASHELVIRQHGMVKLWRSTSLEADSTRCSSNASQ